MAVRDTQDPISGSTLPEWLQMSLALSGVVVLFAACLGVPFLLANSLGVWFGLSGAIIGAVCWIFLIRPMPGFFAGIIALTGLGLLVAVVVVWIVRVIVFVV